MQSQPLVSVIIPVYNCECYLAQAIESVLAQTYQPIELIVVDDGSTDGSAEVAQQFTPHVRYHRQANSGTAVARNRGVTLARGSFLAFLDADDVWVADKLARQLAAFRDTPDLDMVFGHVRQFYSREGQLDDSPAGTMPGYSAIAMLIKRESFQQAGPFDTRWQVGEFIDWYAKAMDAGLRSRMLPDVVALRRIHATNQGITQRPARTDYARILKAALDRRRQQQNPEQTTERDDPT